MKHYLVLVLAAVLMAAMIVAQPSPLAAQMPGGATAEAGKGGAVERTDLEKLVETLEDAEARKRFVKDLRAAIEASKAAEEPEAAPTLAKGLGARLIFEVSDALSEISADMLALAKAARDLPALGAWFGRQIDTPEARAFWVDLFIALIIVLAAGIGAEWLASRLLARARGKVEARESESILMTSAYLGLRTVLDFIPLAVFAAVTYGALSLVAPGKTIGLIVLALVNASVLARAVLMLGRLVLAPKAAGLRLVAITDVNAYYTYIWLRRLTDLTIYGYFAAEAALLLGLSPLGHGVALRVLGLIVGSMAVVLILQNRAGVAGWIRPEQEGAAFGVLRARLADVWHVLAVLYIVALFGVWVLDIEGGFEFVMAASALTVAILVIAKLAVMGLMRALKRGFRVRPEVTAKYPGLEARANRYVPALGRGLRAVVYVISAIFLLQAWGIESLDWLTSDIGLQIVGTVMSIAVILVLALVFWEAFTLAVERYLAKLDGEGARSARARTLLPLARNAVLVVLVVVVGMIVISELGVNIAPLLAGAGVMGIAIGFGAQKLVQDVITGMFILIEDTIAIGDVVKLGDHAGVVEAITIRTIRLRDFGGTVHTMPFNEVSTILNLTKDFSRYVFEIGIAYREDVDQVIEVLKQIGAEMQEDEEFGPAIIQPLEVMGLDKFADSAVVIKARITTQPIKQWMVGREFNRRMKIRFDELGIEIPFPHQTVYFGEDKSGAAPPAYVRMMEGVEKKAAAKPQPAKRKAVAATATSAILHPSDISDAGGDGDL
ncbi:MAG: mechanosensitive ion channel [Proteobacteria bacterium]|nr:mechanosensitive ion channel [Pseudomonadota bacterium]